MCSIDGCSRTVEARGWCPAHYKRWFQHGDPNFLLHASPTQTPDERLRRVGWTVDNVGCWRWNGNINLGGYGQMTVFGKNCYTHRLAYEAWVGPIPEGLLVRHKCDIRDCMNPSHLEVGTHADNSQDMVLRERTPTAKLTWKQVREIRASSELQRVLAERYGVTRCRISSIQTNKTWVETPKRKGESI